MKIRLPKLPFLDLFKFNNGIDRSIKNISTLLTMTIDHLECLCKGPEITGVPTGFEDIDKKTCGLQRADLIVLAARPSMGKTTLGMNICQNIVISQEKPVLVFCPGMSAQQLMMRMLASLSGVDQTAIRTAQLDDEEWLRISDAVQGLKNNNSLYVDDSSFLTPSDIRAKAISLFLKQGELGLIMVDNLQLIQDPENSENHTSEISEVTRALKSLAMELNVPVLALSELKRGLEKRKDKRPIISDLRKSGAIQEFADLIMFVYRDEIYNENSSDKGVAEIIIEKQKNGSIGTLRLAFQGQYSRFADYKNQQNPLEDA